MTEVQQALSFSVSSDPDKVAALTSLTDNIPRQKKIWSFLDIVVFYQQFIENCSSIAKPFFGLTTVCKTPSHVRRKCLQAQWKFGAADWTDECRKAFHELMGALLEQVPLAHPNFNVPSLLSVDASSNGLRAVLSQVPVGKPNARQIAFARKSLSYAQSKYPAHRLELFALKWAA